MSDLIRRLAGLMMEPGRLIQCIDFQSPGNRFMHFLAVGGINTLLGFAIYSFAIINGAEVWVALMVSTITGTLFNFFTTGRYVFREPSLLRFPRFGICYLFIYGLNLTSLEVLSLWLADKIFSQLILLFPIAVLSYFLMSKFVFSKI